MRRPVGVKSILFCWTRCFLQPSRHCRHPSIRTLDERLSLGASWAFSFQPVLPPDCRPVFLFVEKLGQAINAVTGTRLWALLFLSKNVLTLCRRRHRSLVAIAQGFVDFSAHPQTM